MLKARSAPSPSSRSGSSTRTRILAATATLALLATLLAAPAAPAQAPAAVLADATGDVTLSHPQGAAPAPLPEREETGSADLVALHAIERDNDLDLVLAVASLAQRGGTLDLYEIDFTWLDAPYRVELTRSRVDPTAEPLTRASLHLCATSPCVRVTNLEHDLDAAAGTFTARVPKRYVVSLEGHAPVFGSELTGIVARSSSSPDFTGSVRAIDLMPNTGSGVVTYAKGGAANGHIVLEAPDPVRISNGGAATFVFQAHVQNSLDVDDEVLLRIEDLPDGWTATVQEAQRIPPGDERPVFVLATIPFGHSHGGFSAFNLTAASTRAPAARASLQFGVLHTPVPMPAGHHDEVFLHSRPADTGVFGTAFPASDATMSTISDHEGDEALALARRTSDGLAEWRVPLAPQLALGLDFDLARAGVLEGALAGRQPGAGSLAGELWLVRGSEDVALLARLPEQALDLDPRAETPFTFPITPEAAADYVPYAPGNNLELRLLLRTQAPCCSPETPPALAVEAFRMQLPLNEYHDAPTYDEGIASTAALEPEGRLEKAARPGATVTFPFRLTNRGSAADSFDLALAGTDAAASTLAPSGSVRLAPGAGQRVILAVVVPAGAGAGERLESILVARAASDPSNIAIGRTVTLVDPAADAADEKPILDAARGEGRRTPAPGPLALALAAVVALALARRTRA